MPADAGSTQVDVFLSGGKLNIHFQSGTSSTIQVNYLAGSDEWQVLGSFVTEGSGCPDDEVTGQVKCPEGGEDIDVEFSTTGGSVTFAGADSSLDFDSDILLGNGTENVIAGDGEDVIHATSVSTVNGDDIDALDGDDDITTGNGSDIIDAGDGADTVVANNGNNFVNGGEFAGDTSDGADDITGGSLIDDIDGGAGGDTLNGGGDDDEITGGDGDDIINAGPGDDGASVNVVDGEDGNDTVNGGDGTDILEGGADTDTLNGGNQNDTLNGDSGTDTLHGDANDDLLLNSDGPDTFDGGANSAAVGDEVDYSPTTAATSMTIDIDGVADDGRNCPGASCENDNVQNTVENVTGDTSADTITGSSAANDLDGGGGNDTLAGGPGPGGDGGDDFIGGTGTSDLVTYAARTGPITADIDGVADDAGESDDIETDVENLTGGTAGDNLTGSSGANVVSGGPGTANDTVSGAGGTDTLNGGNGTNATPDGADTFNGGPNTDTVSYAGRTAGLTADLDGAAGDDPDGDTLGADVENLTGGSGVDTLTGNSLANVLNGGGGSDTLAGGTSTGADGADTFVGGTNGGLGDTVSYDARTGVITADIDTATGDDIDGDTVSDDIENLLGGAGGDSLTGNAQANLLMGGRGTGNDTLSGGGEDDALLGGTLTNTGPDGADTFIAGAQGSDGDTVSYGSRDDNVTASIGGAADTDGDDIQSAVDNITGGDGNDTLTGDADPNDLRGGNGNDTMAGGTGTGVDGADRFVGGGGVDEVDYSNRDDDVVADLDGIADDGSIPLNEDDELEADVENLTGGDGDDGLTGDDDANVLDGAAGDDLLSAGPGTGADAVDTFIGGTDQTAGGANGTSGDRVTYSSRDDDLTIDIGGGPDAPEGDDVRADVENVTSGDGDDTLIGDNDDNVLAAGNGTNTFRGGTGTTGDGDDSFQGGSGVDTVTYAYRTDDLTIDQSAANSGPEGDGYVGTGINVIIGGQGKDTWTGTTGPNTFIGGPSKDDFSGLAGADTLDARDGGPDTLDCGDDVDTALIDSAALDTPVTACENVDDLPDTEITRHPASSTTKRRAKFEFDSPTAGVTGFECKLDGGDFAACSSPKEFTGLSRGKHKFQVRAIDGDGDRDPTPAKFGWKIRG